MPELPEVESLTRSLRSLLLGLTVARVRVREPGVLRNTTRGAVRGLRGERILGLSRRGKFILFHLSNGAVALFHLKMTGKLLLSRGRVPFGSRERLRLEFTGSDRVLSFEDQRKFGYFAIIPQGRKSPVPLLEELGPDALRISRRELRELLHSHHRLIKSLLLDQRLLAGLGNIYADESLHRAGIHPRQRADAIPPEKVGALHQAMRRILKRAIDCGGSSVATFRDIRSRPGTFQKFHRVYGRKGQRCRRCGTTIEYIRISSRGTYFCPSCQKAPPAT